MQATTASQSFFLAVLLPRPLRISRHRDPPSRGVGPTPLGNTTRRGSWYFQFTLENIMRVTLARCIAFAVLLFKIPTTPMVGLVVGILAPH